MNQTQEAELLSDDDEALIASVGLVKLLIDQEDFHEVATELLSVSSTASEALRSKCRALLGRQAELRQLVDSTAEGVMRQVM